MQTVNRQPQGIPSGGQFAHKTHAEVDISLGEPENAGADWGDVSNIQEGSRTPWGVAQYVSHPAPGIVQASAPGHGGVKLSPERNKTIPPALRRSSGWYEEDCEASIVGMHFPEAFPSSSMTAEDHEATVKEWFPDDWEKATGGTVTADESRVRAEQEWVEAHRAELVATSARMIDGEPDWVAVTVEPLGIEGSKRVLKVPADRYRDPALKEPHGRFEGRWVVPSDGFDDITPPPAPPKPPKPVFHGIDLSKATERQQSLIDRDLNQRWRGRDGTTRTLRDVLESEGFTDKTAIVEGGKRRFYVVTSDSSAFTVSKATWDALEAPDRRSEREKVAQEVRMAEDRQGSFRSWDDEVKNRERIRKLREKLKDASPDRPGD